MEDMKVTDTGYDFRPAHTAMQRYVDGNLLSGFSSAVLFGRDLVDVKCIGWADKEATLPNMTALIRSLLPGGPTLRKPHTIKLMEAFEAGATGSQER